MADIQMVVGVDYSELTGLIKTGEQTKRVLSSVAKDFARTGNQKQYMHAVNKIVMAQKQLDVSARMSRGELMRLGAEMQREQKFTDALTASTNRLGGAIGASKNKMNGSNMAIQQMGYQFGDFAVQVQGGTSAFVAFSQQATQLVGILPMVAGSIGLSMGAAVGLSAALGVIIPIGSAVGRMFMEMNTSANAAAEKIKKFEERVKSAKGETLNMVEALRLLKSGFETEGELALYDSVVKAKDELRLAKIAKENLANLPFESETNRAVATKAANDKIASAEEALALAREDLQLSRNAAAALKKEQERQARDESVINQLVQARAILRQQELDKQKEYKDRLQRIRKIMSDINAERKKEADKQAEINDAQKLANDALVDKNVLLRIEQQYGKDSLKYKQAVASQEAIALEAKLKAKGVDQDLINFAVGQLGIQRQITAQIEKQREVKFNMMEGSAGAIAMRKYAGRSTTSDKDPELDGKSIYADPPKTSSGKTDKEKLAEYLQGKKQEQILEKQLVGVLGEERQIQTELFNIKEKYAGVITPQQEKELENILRLTEAEKERQAVIEEAQAERLALENSITQAMETGFMAMIDGTMSVKDAFKSMAAAIIKELIQVMVVQKAVAGLQMIFGGGGLFGGASWSANGDVVGSSGIQAYADGGVVGGPTMFQHGGGLGVMGEAGPEAIMPLKRGANGKLGVQMEGSGGGDTYVTNNYSISANTSEDTKRLVTQTIQQATPTITANTKASIMNDRRRGGQMKSVFG
jgi:hypothetical protein